MTIQSFTAVIIVNTNEGEWPKQNRQAWYIPHPPPQVYNGKRRCSNIWNERCLSLDTCPLVFYIGIRLYFSFRVLAQGNEVIMRRHALELSDWLSTSRSFSSALAPICGDCFAE